MSLGLSYGPIVSSLDNQAALRKRNMARQNNSSSVGRPTKLVLRSTKAQLEVGLDAVTKWCVLLYPNGNQPERAGFVSLYLYR